MKSELNSQEQTDVLQDLLAGAESLTAAKAATLVGLTASSIYRAIVVGKRMRNGGRIKLEAALIGGIWRTTRVAVERYYRAVTADELGEVVVPAQRPVRKTRIDRGRQDELDRARSEARARGI